MAQRINNGIQTKVGSIGPLQLTNHRVQNRHTGKQKSHWDKKKKEITISNYESLDLSCPCALQYDGFVPREWLAAKDLSSF